MLDTLLTVLDTLLTVLDTGLIGRMANYFHAYSIGTLLDVLAPFVLYREPFIWTGNVEHSAVTLLTVLDTLLTVLDTLLTGWMANYFYAYRIGTLLTTLNSLRTHC